MHPNNNSGDTAARLALFSIASGGASVLFCFSPLVQFPLAMAGLTLAVLARLYNNNHFPGPATAGLILSVAGIAFSLFTFVMIVVVYRVILPDPVLGPEYSQLYQQIMGGFGSGLLLP